MKIAVTFENGNIFQHFGHTEHFKVYDIEDKKIAGTSVLDASGSGHGALAGFLKDADVDALICGGIGDGAKKALASAGIELYGGISGSADKAVNEFIEGTLEFNPNVECASRGGHEHGHECGHHSCGK